MTERKRARWYPGPDSSIQPTTGDYFEGVAASDEVLDRQGLAIFSYLGTASSVVKQSELRYPPFDTLKNRIIGQLEEWGTEVGEIESEVQTEEERQSYELRGIAIGELIEEVRKGIFLDRQQATLLSEALGRSQEIIEMYQEIERGNPDYEDFWTNESRLGGIMRLAVTTARPMLKAKMYPEEV